MKQGKFILILFVIVMLLSACTPTPTIEKVKVTFIGLDGGEISKVEVDKGTTVTPPDLESTEEYTFNGWSLNKDGKDLFDFSTPITTDTTLYSVWTNAEIIEKFTVTFIDTKGSEIPQIEVEKGKRVTPPTLEPIGEYTLYGWSLDKDGENLFDFSTPITSDTTLYSVWMIKEYIDEENNLIYKENKDGTLTVVGLINTSVMAACNIPEMFAGKTVTTIADAAFSPYIREITIPKTVTSISDDAFVYCYYLGSIEVSKENTCFKIIDGALYTMDESKLIYFPVNNFKMVGDTPQAIVEYTIPNSVTEIGGYAFSNNKNLTSIIIPDSVTTIGEGAFYSCGSLTSITIPQSVKSIGEEAFALCYKLTKITIPASVEVIGLNAFYCCTSMNEIIVSPENEIYTSIDGVLFSKDMKTLINYPRGKSGSEYTVPDSVTSLEAYSFFNCDSLERVFIPDSVTQIGDCAFYNCVKLANISIPSTVKSIGERVFENCEKLTSVIIPDTVTSIEERAFYCCSEMTSIFIPASVSSIGNNAFGNCDKLKEITVSDDNKYYTTVDGVLFDKSMSKLICYPEGKEGTSYTIPESVTSLEPYALQGSSLNTIQLPNKLTLIREGALSYMSGISSINIPENVTDIEPYAFAFSGLTEIKVDENNKHYSSKDGVLFNKNLSTLIYYPSSKPGTEYSVPNGVTRIEDYSFVGVFSLQKIIIPESVTSMGKTVFFCCDGFIKEISINKPEGSISGAPWGAIRATVNWQE